MAFGLLPLLLVVGGGTMAAAAGPSCKELGAAAMDGFFAPLPFGRPLGRFVGGAVGVVCAVDLLFLRPVVACRCWCTPEGITIPLDDCCGIDPTLPCAVPAPRVWSSIALPPTIFCMNAVAA